MDTTLSGHFIRCNVHFKRGLTDSERGRQLLDGLMQVFHKLLIATTISGRGVSQRTAPQKEKIFSQEKKAFQMSGVRGQSSQTASLGQELKQPNHTLEQLPAFQHGLLSLKQICS